MRSIGQKLGKIILCGIFALIFIIGNGKSVSALDIEQKDLSVSAHSSTLTIHNNGIGTNDFQITPQLEFNKLGDFITYKLILHNNDGKRYKITSVKDDNANDAIELTYIYPTDLDTTDKSLELTIKYVKKSTTPLQTVTATISLVDEDDVSQQITIVVPNTGTNTITDTRSATIRNTIFIYAAVATAIITIYIIVRRKYQRARKSTKLPKILVTTTLLLGLIPVAVIAATAKDLQFIIEFNSITLNGPYTMTFESNGGTPVPTQTVDHNTYATKPQNPTKPGYTFSKWLDETNTEFDFTATKVTKDYSLTATYTLDTYQLNLDLAGGTAGTPANPISYTYEDNDITLTNPTKDHYDFAGWITPTDNTPHLTVTIPKNSTGDKSYIATWTEKSYTVTFDTNGGTPTPQPQTIKYQQYATEPTTNPSKNGYNFKGWQLNNADYDFTNTKITGDITLTANYEAIKYTINYNLNGGTEGTPANPTEYTIETPDFTLANPTKPNVAFAGWTTPTDNTLRKTVTITQGSTGDKTFIANYKPAYTVTYDTNGGDPINPSSFLVGENDQIGTLIDATKDHYDFVGWYIGSTPIDETYEVTGDIIITAHYTPHKYTIAYNLNGGTETTNPTEYTIETPDFPLAEPTPPSTDKRFKGWTTPTNNTPTKSVTISQGTTGDLTFTAVYQTLFTVTFDPGSEGTIPDSDKTRQVWEDDPIGTLPANPNVTDPLKIFNCWGVNNVCIDATYTVTGDTTVVAIYKDKTTTTVINDLNGKNVTDTCTQASYVASLDYNGNRRYVGRCPKNYVYFNCDRNKGSQFDIYSTEAEEDAARCELWRIIGTFDISNGTKTEKRTKIVRASSIGNFVLDNDNYSGTAQWGKNALSIRLNNTGSGGYLNNDTSYGLKNPAAETGIFKRYYKAQDYIEDALWHIGNPTGTSNDVGKRFAYTLGNDMYVGQKTVPLDYVDGDTNVLTWKGKVGLPNISDFMFASDRDVTYSHCGRTNLSVYSGNNCVDASWMPYTRLMSVVGNNGSSRMLSTWNGTFRYVYNGSFPNNAEPTAPAVYLKANVTIKDGDGSLATPFILGIDE